MSIRTIVEINHDYIRTHDGSNAPFTKENIELLLQYLCGGRDWRSGEIPGIRFLAQRHHSETLKLKVE
jgi:hypothetical protein